MAGLSHTRPARGTHRRANSTHGIGPASRGPSTADQPGAGTAPRVVAWRRLRSPSRLGESLQGLCPVAGTLTSRCDGMGTMVARVGSARSASHTLVKRLCTGLQSPVPPLRGPGPLAQLAEAADSRSASSRFKSGEGHGDGARIPKSRPYSALRQHSSRRPWLGLLPRL